MDWTIAAAALSLTVATDDQTSPPRVAHVVHGLVYFASSTAQRIREPGADVFAHLAPKVSDDAFVFVQGHSDAAGQARANQDLSLRRARSVADELVARGVRPRQITLIACGERRLVVPTAPDAAEPLNRIVVFDWGRTPPKAREGCTSEPYLRP